MELLLLVLAIFVALATTCPPPFNNARFVGNNTAELIKNAMREDGLGWSEVVTHYESPLDPWPRRSDGIVHIRYCFEDDKTEKHRHLLQSAWKKWSDQIGAPSQDNGHRVTFEEFKFDDSVEHKYCYEKQEPPNPIKKWNSKAGLPGDTVVITQPPNPYSVFSIPGYRPANWDSEAGRHKIWIGEKLNEVYSGQTYVAHEIGHVLGLWHEHQRIDRDHYVHFECENLLGYKETKQHVEQEGKHTMEEVCKSSTLGYEYGFSATEWSTEDQEVIRNGWVSYYRRVDGPEYDMDSIMHYFSTAGWNPEKDKNNVMQLPLVKWKYSTGKDYVPPDHVTLDNAELIPTNVHPSEHDKQALKHIYPW